MNRVGRPTTYSEAIAEEICDYIATTGSLRAFCAPPGKPGRSTVMRWLQEHREFRDQYARARELRADKLVDECLEIADDARFDWVVRIGRNGDATVAADHEHISRSRLRVDTRKWCAARLAPKKYGDRAARHLGGQKENPLDFASLARRAASESQEIDSG